FALALLTAVALGGCSQIKGVLKGDKEEKAAQAKLVALRARTDSLRKARRVADSLAQVQFTICADSVRAEMTKPVVVKATKKKKKKQPAVTPPSEELIASQVQTSCVQSGTAPQQTVAATSAKPAPSDSMKQVARAGTPAAAPPAADVPATPATSNAMPPAAQPDLSAAQGQDPAYVDSVQKAKEMEMSRETFAYSGAARDPFSSLLNMAKNGPELADLQLVGIYQNLRTPAASIAVFREKDGGKRHKLRAGDQLGRSRLVQIRDRDVVFMIEDFGFERQETLSLRKQEDVTP
ncbi:MAG TPA: hypothetical protein VFX42_09680, partial [Gemmatimonadales bacterium]|nr:hypothetical protein [Gemmatimonadales bacterium]